MMSGPWQCENCSTTNIGTSCTVCGRQKRQVDGDSNSTRSGGVPVVPVVSARTGPPGSHDRGYVGHGPGSFAAPRSSAASAHHDPTLVDPIAAPFGRTPEPNPYAPTGASTPEPSPPAGGGQSRPVLIGVLAAAALIVAAGAGWFTANNLGSGDDRTALVTSKSDGVDDRNDSGTDDPGGPGGGAERSSTSAAPVVARSGGTDATSGWVETSSTTTVSGSAAASGGTSSGDDGPGTTTQRTNPPTSSPPTTSPPLLFNDDHPFSDPDRRVTLALPDMFAVDRDFDGRSAQWSGGGVVAHYEVVGASGLATADARVSELMASLKVEIYTALTSANRKYDGRYVVSGMRDDGTYFYERGKIRCGYLARYRLEWTGREKHPTAEAIVNTWYNDLEELDSMGGVHPIC